MKKTIHIIVKDGLVQEVYTDKDANIEVLLYDLDAEDADNLAVELAELKVKTKQIY